MSPTEARIALNLLPKIGPIRVQRLLEIFETPEQILRAKAHQIQQIDGFGADLAQAIAGWQDQVDLSRELRRIREENLTIITPEDALFPDLLRQIHDPPLVLYVRGQLSERNRHSLAIVGVRRASQYGLSTARKLAFQFAHAGYTIVSGLARGIDTAAHEGALAARGRTLAIIGSGHARLYPPENAALAERIATQGAVISEYPVDYPPDKITFPQRNRIVSGCSQGVIVVEAALRSGSLITANQAMDQGRTVFAVPGNIDRPSSQGCNKLIQQGAKLVTDGADILEEFNFLPNFTTAVPESLPPPDLSTTEAAVHAALGSDETHINDLVVKTNLPVSTISTALMKLELKKLVRPLPGKFYVRMV